MANFQHLYSTGTPIRASHSLPATIDRPVPPDHAEILFIQGPNTGLKGKVIPRFSFDPTSLIDVFIHCHGGIFHDIDPDDVIELRSGEAS